MTIDISKAKVSELMHLFDMDTLHHTSYIVEMISPKFGILAIDPDNKPTFFTFEKLSQYRIFFGTAISGFKISVIIKHLKQAKREVENKQNELDIKKEAFNNFLDKYSTVESEPTIDYKSIVTVSDKNTIDDINLLLDRKGYLFKVDEHQQYTIVGGKFNKINEVMANVHPAAVFSDDMYVEHFIHTLKIIPNSLNDLPEDHKCTFDVQAKHLTIVK